MCHGFGWLFRSSQQILSVFREGGKSKKRDKLRVIKFRFENLVIPERVERLASFVGWSIWFRVTASLCDGCERVRQMGRFDFLGFWCEF